MNQFTEGRLRLAAHFTVLLALLVALYCGRRSLDFGPHWDEPKQIEAVERSLKSGIFLPQWYKYPSVSYTLVLLTLAPSAVRVALSPPPGKATVADVLQKEVRSRSFLLRVRGTFLAVTSAAILWVYLLVLRLRREPLEAAFAACSLALSWEVAYHARWIAPDAVVLQFTALTLMLLCLSDHSPKGRLWQGLAAMSAGLACGTKYPAGMLLLPVMAAPWLFRAHGSQRRRWRRSLALAALFGVAYLASTPGTLLEPATFIKHVEEEMRHYATAHSGNTVVSWQQHLGLMLVYLTTQAFSKYWAISVLFLLLLIVGAASLMREEKRMAVLFIGFPVLFLGYMSQQKVMIVRNLLILFPFFAVLCARGAGAVHRFLQGRAPLRFLMPAIAAACFVVNAAWLLRAARGLTTRTAGAQLAAAARYIDEHPEVLFRLSSRLAGDLARHDGRPRANVVKGPEAQRAAFYSKDMVRKNSSYIPTNWPGRYVLPEGAFEVNIDYYPAWLGFDDYVIVAPVSDIGRMGLKLE